MEKLIEIKKIAFSQQRFFIFKYPLNLLSEFYQKKRRENLFNAYVIIVTKVDKERKKNPFSIVADRKHHIYKHIRNFLFCKIISTQPSVQVHKNKNPKKVDYLLIYPQIFYKYIALYILNLFPVYTTHNYGIKESNEEKRDIYFPKEIFPVGTRVQYLEKIQYSLRALIL